MGGVDKALVTLGGLALIDLCAGRVAPQVARLAISAAGDPARFARLGLPVIADPEWGDGARKGPLAGILAAMIWARGCGAAHVASVPVDGPFVPLDLVARLGCAPVPRLAMAGGRHHPTFGIWPVALAPDLYDFLASGAVPRLRDFAERALAQWAEFPDETAFGNLNTPGDLARAQGAAP